MRAVPTADAVSAAAGGLRGPGAWPADEECWRSAGSAPTGAMARAEAAIAAAEARAQEYEAKLRAARAEIFHAREQRVQAMQRERDRVLEEARHAAQETVRGAARSWTPRRPARDGLEAGPMGWQPRSCGSLFHPPLGCHPAGGSAGITECLLMQAPLCGRWPQPFSLPPAWLRPCGHPGPDLRAYPVRCACQERQRPPCTAHPHGDQRFADNAAGIAESGPSGAGRRGVRLQAFQAGRAPCAEFFISRRMRHRGSSGR